MSWNIDEIEKRLVERRDRILKLVGDPTKNVEQEFTNALLRQMFEFEQKAEDAIKSNDPLNAAAYQWFTDIVYYYVVKRNDKGKAILAQYRRAHGL
ncbi:MAG: hypothetical protein ABI347_00165 [Nitrososphaera sp.]|jgi:hypothetical protein